MDITYTLAGFFVGFVIGLTGVGGGSLMTPILVLLFNFKAAIAVGTDLLYAAITKSGGIFIHHKRGTIEWKIVGLLSLGSIPSAMISVFILKHLKAYNINYDNIISISLSIALILTSLVILFREQIQALSLIERFDSPGRTH